MRVLHVVESYGAGTASALVQYVRATPELEHHLVRRLRDDDDHADDGELTLFASVHEMDAGVLPAVRSVRRAVKAVGPDVVHGHSSFGGAFARLAAGRRPLVVHTPHCYATERADLGRPARAAYEVAERLLSYNTQVVAGCSRRETALGRSYAPKARHVVVPNVSDLRADGVERAEPPVVTAMGRLTAQRDPLAFLDVVRRLDGNARARWIGDGDDALKQQLLDGGVEVTGWLPRSEAIRLLGESTVYVHTARWDGAPMTMIEAHALGLPQLAVTSPAVADGPAGTVAPTTDELADALLRLLADPQERAANLAAWDGYFEANTVDRQRGALLEAYGVTQAVEAAR
jgi:glycosyltransferase involved in cell wall biosynthesis